MVTKKERAIQLRDLAVAVVRARGMWQEVSGRRVLEFRHGDWCMILRTPFQKLHDAPRESEKYWAALEGRPPRGLNLPYGVDVWCGPKVLNVEWDDNGLVDVIGYKPGSWERELEKLARDA
jgi:hypothetical protein